MAVAAEALEEGAAAAQSGAEESTAPGAGFQAISQASGHLRRPPGAARAYYNRSLSTPSAAAQTVVKIIWAVALGLIVLEIAAQATGQTWSLALGRGVQTQKPQKGAYLPLYAGQSQTVTAAMPGVLPNSIGNTAPVAGQVLGFVP